MRKNAEQKLNIKVRKVQKNKQLKILYTNKKLFTSLEIDSELLEL